MSMSARSQHFGDGTIDAEDRKKMRQGLSVYSREQRATLRQFIDLLIAEPHMRKEQTLRILAYFLCEAEVKRKDRQLRSVPPLGDEVDDDG